MTYNIASYNNHKKVEKMVRRILRHLRKKEYELNLPKNAADVAVEALCVIDEPMARSVAGAALIMINVGGWNLKFGQFSEYKRYAADPVIGSLKKVSPDHALMALVAHEVSHHIQFRYARSVHMNSYERRRFADWTKPHGQTFQDIYRMIRRDLINPMISQKETINA